MKFEVCILGSSAATPASSRGLTAQVLNIRENFMLIDCGEATQIQMRRFKQSFQKLQYIFISHLHGDHCWGLPGLLSSMNLLGRKTALEIFAPKGLKAWIEIQLKTADTYLDFPIIYHELITKTSTLILEHPVFEVYTVPLKHRVYCNGFIFKEKIKKRKMKENIVEDLQIPYYVIPQLKEGKDVFIDGKSYLHQNLTLDPEPSYSYAYISDSIYDPSLVPMLKNVDLLYHESTFMHNELERAKHTFHSTAHQAAQIALAANVKKLLLGHISARYMHKENELEQEARTIFPNSELVLDGQTYQIY